MSSDWADMTVSNDLRATPGFTRRHLFVVALTIALVLGLSGALSEVFSTDPAVALANNDDLMRLYSIREWFAGQGWFDTTIDRVVPPEGVSLHWSRYVDLGIALIIWPVAQVASMDTAETTALLLWPSLMLVAFIFVTGRTGMRLFGPLAAAVAVLAVVLWPVSGSNYFYPGALDHHNIQILLLAIVVFSLIGTGQPLRDGVIGGAAAALSLAIGLENLLSIGVAGVVLYVALVAARPGADRQLLAFATTLLVLAALLFAGQTPPSEWTLAQCDELGPPVLGLTVVAGVTSWVAVRILSRRQSSGTRILIAAVIAAAALVAVVPVLLSCTGGPYGNLSDELRAIISTSIIEARPAQYYAIRGNRVFFTHVLPALTTVSLASLLWVLRHRRGTDTPTERYAAGILLLFGWIGVAGAFYQIRLIVLAAPAIPLLMGYLLSALVDARVANRSSTTAALALIGATTTTLFLPGMVVALWMARALVAQPGEGEAPWIPSSNCATPAILGSLDSLPKARLLSDLNLGPALLVMTHHDILSAPYHRSAAALGNGILPFKADESGFRDMLATAGAEYLVLCRGTRYSGENVFVNGLASGETAPGFIPVEGADPALVVLEISR